MQNCLPLKYQYITPPTYDVAVHEVLKKKKKKSQLELFEQPFILSTQVHRKWEKQMVEKLHIRKWLVEKRTIYLFIYFIFLWKQMCPNLRG